VAARGHVSLVRLSDVSVVFLVLGYETLKSAVSWSEFAFMKGTNKESGQE